MALIFCPQVMAVETRVIATVMEARLLSPEDVDRGLPVKIRGVITYHEPGAGLTYVQDDTGGMAIAAGLPSKLGGDVCFGAQVEVEGVVSSSAYAPVVAGLDGQAPVVRVLGEGTPPAPAVLGLEKLSHGTHDGLWIEMPGVIRGVQAEEFVPPGAVSHSDRLRVHLVTVAGGITMIIPWHPKTDPPLHLIDARVRVRCVLGSITNSRKQWVGVLLFVPSIDQMHMERPASEDAFSLPLRQVDELLRFDAHEQGEDRVRLQGQVTMIQPGVKCFLRCSQGSIEISPSQTMAGIRIGDVLDVAGYPNIIQSRVRLQNCVYRIISQGEPPKPQVLTYAEVMDRFVDRELVRMQGRLLENIVLGARRSLLVEMDGRLVEASFPSAMDNVEIAKIQRMRTGAVLELTGISQVTGSPNWDGSVKALGLGLNLRGAGDVRVVRAASWLTTERVLYLLGGLMVLSGVIAAWAITLRRRVVAQTVVIRQQALREASGRERMRIARNIHDDLGSRLTQLALLGERVKSAVGAAGPAAELGERISSTASSAVSTMDEIVWAVNPRNDSLQSLADYLCQLAPAQLADAGIHCELDVPAVLPAHVVGAETRHGLVLAVREILHNVVKHSGAHEAKLLVRLLDGLMLEISLSDEGRGFDPSSVSDRRNGLLNLRARMAEAGGQCDIESHPGTGTRVTLRVPLDSQLEPTGTHTFV